MALTIRPVKDADADSWLRMRRALWLDGGEDEHASEIADFLAGEAPEPLAVLLALDGIDRAVGFVELSIRPYAEGCRTQRVAYLEGWYVVPERRGQAVGWVLGGRVRSGGAVE